MSAPVAVIQHGDDCPPGLVGEVAADMGVRLQVCEAYRGEPVPATMEGYSGLIVLGGQMNANADDQFPWLAPTKNLLAEAVTTHRPVLGICLGHQLMAVALGGNVDAHPEGPARGVYRVRLNQAGRQDPVLGSLPVSAACAQWNRDCVLETPPGAVVLANDPDGFPLAIRYGTGAWGVQCHPELVSGIAGWWRSLTDASRQPGGDNALEIAVLDMEEALSQLQLTWRPVLAAFLALTQQ